MSKQLWQEIHIKIILAKISHPNNSVNSKTLRVKKHIKTILVENSHCIVLYLRLFANMGVKTNLFTIQLCKKLEQKQNIEIKVLPEIRYKYKAMVRGDREEELLYAEKHEAGQEVSIVTNWEVEKVGSRAQVVLDGSAQCTQTSKAFW